VPEPSVFRTGGTTYRGRAEQQFRSCHSPQVRRRAATGSRVGPGHPDAAGAFSRAHSRIDKQRLARPTGLGLATIPSPTRCGWTLRTWLAVKEENGDTVDPRQPQTALF